jgi:hypothetical protein
MTAALSAGHQAERAFPADVGGETSQALVRSPSGGVVRSGFLPVAAPKDCVSSVKILYQVCGQGGPDSLCCALLGGSYLPRLILNQP